MREPQDMDELLAQADPVDAAPHTARRAVGLATALLASGAAVAIALTGSAHGLLVAVLWLATLGGSRPLF
ncbi:hypothetical protein [Curtobacterium oceanosedimentum]|uniref:hypothetical protein n=1 Tax=Curtobacterium oceanosedimentum TaxID=465820 RepID=UPI001CE2127B|nr:hypothetical protein [Curtobacterium oceanosedimentum]MCA5922174.1 hypothetical protein [Curtobacterium oceanosedimentum]